MPIDQSLGTDRFLAGHVVGDDGPQYLELAIVHGLLLALQSRRTGSTGGPGLSGHSLALAQTECQSSLMSQPDPAFPAGVEPSIGPWRTVAPGVFVAVAEPDAVNLGLIVGADAALLVRSEERRVGKEGRLGWQACV